MNRASKVYTSHGEYKADFGIGGDFSTPTGSFKIHAIHVYPGTGVIILDDDKVVRATFPWHSIYLFVPIHEEESAVIYKDNLVSIDGTSLVN